MDISLKGQKGGKDKMDRKRHDATLKAKVALEVLKGGSVNLYRERSEGQVLPFATCQ